jgi:hypothetical protein
LPYFEKICLRSALFHDFMNPLTNKEELSFADFEIFGYALAN